MSWRALPNKKQLLILGICRLSEPLSNTALLAYVYYLLKFVLTTDSHIPSDAQISRYSGFLVGAFPLGQFVTSLLWGYVSDLYGRKSIIIIGLVLSLCANLGFGLSRSFPALLFWRAVAGMANGNTSVMRTMSAEIVKEKKFHPRAFLLLPLIFNTGRVLALAVGGCLANPVETMPGLFGESGFFNSGRNPGGVAWALAYPFALPSLINVAVLICSLVLAIFQLKETYPWRTERAAKQPIGKSLLGFLKQSLWRKRSMKYSVLDGEEAQIGQSETEDTIQQRPQFFRIWNRRVAISLITFGLLPLHNNSFTYLFPLYLSSPTLPSASTVLSSMNGGLGLSSKSVGLCLSLLGICGIVLKFLTYPTIQNRLGTLQTFRIALGILPIIYFCVPWISLLHKDGIMRWICISVLLFVQIMARGFAIPSAAILLTDAAPSRSVLGTVHGAGNMIASLARAVGPAVGGMVFAWGMDGGIGSLAWWAWLVPVSVLALAWSYFSPRFSDTGEISELEMT